MAVFAYIDGYCPACGGHRLFVRNGERVASEDDRKVRCARHDCPDPLAAHKILQDPEIHHIVRFDEKGYFNAKHPLRERCDGELLDCEIHEVILERTEPMSFDEHKALHDTTWRVRPAGEHNLDANWIWEQLA